MKNVKVAYWDSKTGEITVLGSATTPNEMGALIANKINNVKEALSKGILYFSPADNSIIPCNKPAEQLAPFIEHVFLYEDGLSPPQLQPE